MPRVVADLEADVVGSEQPAQHLLARGQQAVHLGRREGRVQEEADRETRRAAAEHRGHEHEVEVVHPHARLRAAALEDRVREALVDVHVVLPRLGRQPEPVAEVVQERPERVVADLAVEVLLLVRGEIDRDEVLLRELLGGARLEVLGDDRARPADPDRVAADRSERGGEPARGRLDLDVVARDREPHGQAVARDHEAVVSGLRGQRFLQRLRVGRAV